MDTISVAEPGGAPTRDSLITTAERLFGQFGIDGASLRQISREAGCANVVAAQYHFRDKTGLVQAILDHRLPKLAKIRKTALSDAGEDPSIRRLVEIVMLPLLDWKDENGRLSFARFLLQLALHPRFGLQIRHPVPSIYHFREVQAEESPQAAVLFLLGQRLPKLPPRPFLSRIGNLQMMFLGTLIADEDARANGLDTWPLTQVIEDQITMIVRALDAPLALNSWPDA